MKKQKYNNILTKEFLKKEYIDNKNSARYISEKINTSIVTVLKYLRKNNIKIRSRSESTSLGKIGKKRKAFSIKWRKNMSVARLGKNNPFYGKKHTLETKTKMSNVRKTEKFKKIAIKNLPKNVKGKNNGNWYGGISKLPYAFNFDEELKERIRERDNHKCQMCGKDEKNNKKNLSVHHIDYNKQNSNKYNLISLCQACHIKTNINRDYWYAYFKYLMENEK